MCTQQITRHPGHYAAGLPFLVCIAGYNGEVKENVMIPPNSTPFTRKMYELCELAPKRVKGYFPTDFHSALISAGDDFSLRAKEFLRAGIQTGLERLAKGGALDISMEWSIAYDPWDEFSQEDRALAHERLSLVARMHGQPTPPPPVHRSQRQH